MKKRILSVLIAVVMLIGMLPTAVFAAGTTEAKWAFGTAETAPDDSAYTYSGTLAEAFTAANGNEVTYVKLNKDVSMTHTSSATALTLNEGKAMVLDLNSKTYSSSTTSTSGGDATYGIKTEPNSLLTVKNGTISVSSSNDGYAIGIKSKGNLNVLDCTIEASKSNANSGAYGISYSGGVATITNCTITATSVGDRAQGIEIGTTTPALTIADCIVNAIGGDEAYAFYASTYWGKMEFDVAGTITATCENGAFYSKPTTNEVTVTAGEAEGTATDADASEAATYANKYVRIKPVKYDLYIGGAQVTSANKDNIVVPGATGSATYDPETSTLTLNNFSYTGEGYVYDSPWCAAIFAENDLTVKVVGSNTVTASVTDPYTAEALNVWGALTITGDSGSSLTLTGAGREGVGCDDLKIENVTVNATGTSGLYSYEGITIHNAIVNAVGNGDNAIYSTKAVSITNSSVTATAPSGDGIFIYNSYQNLTINNSMLTASVKSNGINVSMGSVHVTNSFIDITTTDGFAIESRSGGGQKAISPYFTDGSDNYVVYAGDDAGSATEADASADATYANKYVKIEPVCTVTVNYGIDGVDNKEITVTKGDTISLENPVVDGYLFMGWFTDDTYQTAFDFYTPITADTTVYAKFADYEGDKTELNNKIDAAKAELQGKIDAVESALAGKADAATLAQAITDLYTAKTNIQNLLEQIDDYKDADTALKTTLEAADAAMNAAITELQNRVTAIETALNGIDLSQIATNTQEIADLTTELGAVKTTVDQLENTFVNNTELSTAIANLKTELDGADDALEVLIDTLDGRVDDIEDALDGIDLSQIATNKQDIIDLTTELGNLDDLVNTINTNYASADANLQTQITALDTKLTELIDETIAELTDSVNKLKDDLNTANGKIDTNTGDITTLKTNVSTLKTWQTEAQNAIEALETLTGTQGTNISALQTAVAELQATMNTANGKIAAAENRIAALEDKVSALETAKTNLENAVSALQTAVADKADTATVNAAIAELKTAIEALEAVKNNYIGADDDLRTELEGKIATAKGEAIASAETLVNNAKADLQSKIDVKADAATTTAAIQNLQAAVAALEAVKDDYATADATLKTELEGKIANAQTAAISAAETLVNNAKAELQSKIDAKADAATTTAAIQNLQAAVAALEAVKDDYATADATLKTELEGKIETAKSEAITAANTALTTAKNELSQAIALKADTATLNAKVDALNTAIANAESVAKAYADTQDAALKAELQTAIANAKSEAIGAAQLLVDNAKAELQTAIDTKADTATVNAAIANLQNAITALEAAKDNYASADAALKLELEAAIERAKQEAIEASKGYIPYIGTNGNWWIGDTDTGVDANGIKGDTGATGNGIASITTSKANGITTVTIKFTDPNMADVVFTIEDGADGADGAKGDKGDTGAQGAQGEKGDKGDKGDTGAQGEKGDKGNTGAAGADGVGIAKIEKTSSDGNVDTYTITLTNGTTYTFTVTNGTDGKDGKDGTNGKDGVDGKDGTNGTNGVDGKDGANGADGQTPYIGENGNWWIGDTDTGVKAAGDDGKDGAIIVATAVGGTALISNIALIAWALIKKKRLF